MSAVPRPPAAETGDRAVPFSPSTDADPVLRSIRAAGVLPVVVIDDAELAAPLGDVLLDAGLPCVEVTLRTPAAPAALRALSRCDGLLVGAGTVLDADQADGCLTDGARFLVSPGYDGEVVERCRNAGALAIPGAVTGTEVQRARRAGLRVVKFFPAAAAGGYIGLRALAAPFPDMHFLPTGGIGLGTLREYLRDPAVLAVGGTWPVPRRLIANGCWDEIHHLAVHTVAAVAVCRAYGGVE
ncbi:bifunctional 4-hydroxy-2-oxoglutarate aldolase/2-dehydro-3-deoxy-phosphogluconate aldolase [Streptomyces sp. NPDC001922]|uniref:bifunctional 4-hydroxy-2-oxoglutarate aldolase/2-dehydro-3-deoxy-phosphogluconate aldolase n=1 Tax=Streptomyces sp. NPDC001922 TaxID=3364624 RepID=UPI003687A7F4